MKKRILMPNIKICGSPYLSRVNCFEISAKDVVEHFNFIYPLQDDRNMTTYLKQIRDLPPDAKEIIPSENRKD